MIFFVTITFFINNTTCLLIVGAAIKKYWDFSLFFHIVKLDVFSHFSHVTDFTASK